MAPKASFWGKFSHEGRIKNLWAQAQAEPHPEISLNLWREVLQRLLEHPAELQHLWLPLLDILLTPMYLRRLTNRDIALIEHMGNALVGGVAHPLRPEEIWFRALHAYQARAQEPQIRNLFVRIYFSPTATWEEKTSCVHELAYRQEISEWAISAYIDYLPRITDPTVEPAILKLLGELCTVDFTTARAGLERAGRLAQRLSTNKTPLSVEGLHNAQGLYILRVLGDPAQAVQHFTAALYSDARDRIALLGVLSCRIQLGQYKLVTEMARQPEMSYFSRDPMVHGLLQLSIAISWLDHQEVVEMPLDTIETLEHLRNLGLPTYAGDIVDATLGRLYLLSGNARRARDLLVPLLGTTMQLPQWAYYAAWAEMLAGNHDGVAYCFSNAARWSGKWTTACLLIDIEPRLAEKSGAFSLLRGILSSPVQVKQSYLPAISTRLALATARMPPQLHWPRETGSLEEDLESLRTYLGALYYHHQHDEMERELTHSLFLRLPLAERLLWRGLIDLGNSDRRKNGLALLDRAATGHRYYRACLVLTLYYVEANSLSAAQRYLNMTAAIRDDARTAMVRAFIAGRMGQRESALQQLEQISAPLDMQARAFFARGILLLQQASQVAVSGQTDEAREYREQAVELLASALSSGKEFLPGYAESSWHSAQFLAQPDRQNKSGATLWPKLERLDAAQRHPWLRWNAMLDCLWYGFPDEVVAASNEIIDMFAVARRTSHSVTEILVLALAAVSTRLSPTSSTDSLLVMLEQLAAHHMSAAVKQACDVSITLLLRERYKKADAQERYQVRQDLMRRASAQPDNEGLALLLAATSVENRAKAAAIHTLRACNIQNGRLQHLWPYLANLLAGEARVIALLPELEIEDGSDIHYAYEILCMAAAFSGNQFEKGYTILYALLLQHGSKMADLIDLQRVLPHLCAYSLQKENVVPPGITEVLHFFTTAHLADNQYASLARCATAIGAFDLAEILWKQAFATKHSQEIQQEYTRFLYYQAVHAYLADNSPAAIRYLLQAIEGPEQDFANNHPLRERVRQLEQRQALRRLVAYLSASASENVAVPGRYACFEEMLNKHSALLQVLFHGDMPAIEHEWRLALNNQQPEISILHALSIITWETALARLERREVTEREWLSATGLWIMLLSADAFWNYFSHERWNNGQDERSQLPASQQEKLRQAIIHEMLSFHSASAKNCFATGLYDTARIHLLCLDMCRRKSRLFFDALQRYQLPCLTDLNEETLNEIAIQASKMLDEWCAGLVAEAEKVADDAEAIEHLPEGITRNYSGALHMLSPFLDFELPVRRILCAALKWYNDWCYDVHVLQNKTQLALLVQSAEKVAEQLIPLSVKGNGYAQENKLLSQHFLLRGLFSELDNPTLAASQYEEALIWDPTNRKAQGLSEQASAAFSFNEEDEEQELADEKKGRTTLADGERIYQTIPEEETTQAWREQMQEPILVRPNPFYILALPTCATREEIVTRTQELSALADTREQELLYHWAMEQLITSRFMRLKYELFELPATRYDEDAEWDRFVRAQKQRPVELDALTRDLPPPGIDDINLGALLWLILDTVLVLARPDITVAIDGSPYMPVYSLPVEMRDIIFG
jgi:hypothetical protein